MATPGSSAAARRSHPIRFGLLTTSSPVIIELVREKTAPKQCPPYALLKRAIA
jgi:hypothetical protein